MTLSDVQMHLHALINSSTILLGRSHESDLHALQLSYLRYIGTAILFYHLRGQLLKPGLTWLTREWLRRNIQDHGCGGHNPEKDSFACIDLLKARLRILMVFPAKGPGSGGSGRIMSRSWRASRNRGSQVKWARMVIVYPGSPGAWDGTSTAAPAMTVACANNAQVSDRLLGAPTCHELIFGRLMGLTDALGIMPKAGADLPGAENAERQIRTGAAETKTKTESAETPPSLRLQRQHPVRSHDEPECEPDRDTPSSPTNQQHGNRSSSRKATEAGGGAPRLSTADDRALEEAGHLNADGLLFVGVTR
ncbi:hypothetical protein EDB84DRAFT_1434650 [Lactarius hengduanensis]|nr:hypothetical protein EDB84DRAFT_1434650 [Lactarius hengduanensis]